MKLRYCILLMSTMLFVCCSSDDELQAETPQSTNAMTMNITISNVTHEVTLVNNAATQTLLAKLKEGPVTVKLDTNGNFEIWGSLGFSLPSSNEYINGQPGDVVLYSGSNICIFYGYNSYSYTRLGRINGLSADELKTFLRGGESDISVTLSQSEATAVRRIKATEEKDVYYTLDGQRVEHPSGGIYVRKQGSAKDHVRKILR